MRVADVVELHFNQSLYEMKAVDASVKAYAALMTAELVSEPAGVLVRLRSDSHDIHAVADHFANHVLHTTIALRSAVTQGEQ